MYVKLTLSSSSTTSNVSRFFLKSRRVILGLNGNIYVKIVCWNRKYQPWLKSQSSTTGQCICESHQKKTNFAGSLKNKDSGWCESQSIFSSIPSLHISIEHFYTAVSHYLTSILHRFFWAGTINTLPFKCLGLVWFFVMFFCSFIVEDCIYLIKNTVKKLYCEIILQFETTVLLELSMLKTVVLLNICVEIMIHFWRILWRLESSKEQHLLEIEIFLTSAVTFDQFNASMLNKSITVLSLIFFFLPKTFKR